MSWHPGSKFLTVDGRQAHCVDVGRGPTVLLLHGFLHSSYTWRSTIAALSGRYRVIAPCLFGFGWAGRGPSDYSLEGFTGWVRGILDALGVRRVHATLGNSLGGGIALRLALQEPARVGRLVLVSTLGPTYPVPGLPLRLLNFKAFEPLFRATAGSAPFIRRALSWTAYKRIPVDQAVLAGFAQLRRPGSLTSAVETARQLWPASKWLGRRLEQVRVPTLVVWGRRDSLLPLAYGRRAAARIPGARLEVFQECGHCAHEEHPDRFNLLVERFLQEEQRREAPSRLVLATAG